MDEILKKFPETKTSQIQLKKYVSENKNYRTFIKLLKFFYENEIERFYMEPLLQEWGDIDYVFLYACSLVSTGKEHIEYLLKEFNEIDGELLLFRLAQFKEFQNNLRLVASQVLDIFNIEMNTILDYKLREYSNPKFEEFLNSLKDKEISYAPIPEWVSLNGNESVGMLEYVSREIISDTKSAEELKEFSKDVIDKLIISQENNLKEEKDNLDEDYLKEDSISVDEAVNIYLSIYNSYNVDEAQNIDEKKIRNRVWGPANVKETSCKFGSLIDNRDSMKEPSQKEPCRMLSCICYTDEGDDEEEWWFDGTCDVCNLKIRNESHAVRFPYVNGGWYGCYCCIDCMKRDHYITHKEEYMVNMLEDILQGDGIMDRVG